ERGNPSDVSVAMEKLGQGASRFVPKLRRRLDDEDASARLRALDLAAGLDPSLTRSLVPRAVELLEDDDAQVVRAAWEFLVRAGPEAAAAVPRPELLFEVTSEWGPLGREV